MSLPGLSVVIPSYNRPDLLRDCLASVQRHLPANTEIIVVDDCSPEGVIGQTAHTFAGVRVLRMPERRGFCAAVNLGIRAATQPIVELLNDDTEVQKGWAEAALAAFADPTIGAVAPLVLRWPGGEPGQAIVDSAGDGYHLGGVAGKLGHGQVLTAAHLVPREVFGASGSSAFYRRDLLLHVGLFPEAFGAYFEDVDLAFRIHWAGFRIWYQPASCVWHHVSASYGVRPPAALLEQQSRNEELVFWRNLPTAVLLRALPLHALVLLGKAWRRWRAGELRPFLRGRLQVLNHCSSLRQHRRQLRQLADPSTPVSWHGHLRMPLTSWFKTLLFSGR